MAGWQPAWRILVAFNNAVFDDPALITSTASPPGTLGAINVWTDITADVRDAVDTNRGRQHETDRFQTGTLAFTLDNRLGRYDPWNTASPYTGKVIPGKPVRLQATDPNTSTTTALFTGVTDVWTTGWAAPSYATVQLSCVDWFAYMTNQYLNTSLYPKTVLADSPNLYMRMGDPVGSAHLADSSAHANSPSTPGGTVVLGQAGAVQNNSGTGADLANGTTTPAGYIYVTPNAGLTGTAWTVECWYKTSSWSAWGGTTNILYAQIDAGGFGVVQVYVTPTGILNILDITPGTGITDLAVASASPIPADGNWHHLAATTTSPYLYIDGNAPGASVITNTGVTAKTAASTIVGAQLGGFPSWPGMLAEFALYPTALPTANIRAHYNAGGAPVETSGARIARIASWSAIPTANAAIDNGKSLVQAITAAVTTTTTISYDQLVEQTEDGAFFMSGAGQLRFMSRDAVYTNLTSTVTFGDNPGEIPFELAPTIALDTLDQYVSTSVQRNGGNTQIADTGQLGKQYQQSGLLQTNDTEVLGLANWLLGQFSIAPKPRIRSITVHPVVTPTGTATTALLGLELGAVVTVNRHTLPGAGTAFAQICNVEGINHHIDPGTGDWNVLLQLTPLPPQRPWILGTSQLGVDTTLFF